MIDNNQKDNSKREEKTINVQGMTCHSCEMLVERSWQKLDGVCAVKADSSLGTVKLVTERNISPEELQSSLSDQKYKVVNDRTELERRTRPKWSELAGLFALAAGLAWVITRLGALVSGGQIGQQVGIGTAIFLGLLASVSSCLAVVSGLLISSTAQASHGSDKLKDRITPAAMFIIGRIGSYALLGGGLGWIGAKISFSSTTTAVILALAAAYMILIGLDMLHVLPVSVRKYLPGTPKALTHGILDKAQQSGTWLPLVMGAATFFLPCGFTQALQAYALTTGSFWTSAVLLGAFAVGTAPGLLAFGLATSSLKGKTGKFVFKVAGALVVVLGLLNLNNGIALAGFRLPSADVSSGDSPALTSTMDAQTGEQVVRMKVTDSGYEPKQIVVKAGVPLRWEIDNQARGCATTLVVNRFGINEYLKQGQNVFKVTPKDEGRVPFSCSMGMIRGEMIVVKEGGTAQAAQVSSENPYFMRDTTKPVGASCGASGGGCGGCGGSFKTSPTEAGSAADAGTSQTFKVTYDSVNDISPNVFRVKIGTPVRLEIDAKENGSGCMSTITIPGLYDEIQSIRKGPMTIEFTPAAKGTYDITCAMGVPRGQVIVE